MSSVDLIDQPQLMDRVVDKCAEEHPADQVQKTQEACGNRKPGACDWFSGLLSDNPDVIDWGYVDHKADPHEKELAKDYQEGDVLQSDY